MMTLGELKTNILKILCEYSKNGQILTEDTPAVADRNLSMDFAIDVAMRKVKTVFGLQSATADIECAENERVAFPLPSSFAACESLLMPSGEVFGGFYHVADSKLCFKGTVSGVYTLVYKHYPQSIEGKEDGFEIAEDAYTLDAVAYGAAAELCDKNEAELYTRIKYRFDELCLNRYNVDKLSTPPYNRVYAQGKRKRYVI